MWQAHEQESELEFVLPVVRIGEMVAAELTFAQMQDRAERGASVAPLLDLHEQLALSAYDRGDMEVARMELAWALAYASDVSADEERRLQAMYDESECEISDGIGVNGRGSML